MRHTFIYCLCGVLGLALGLALRSSSSATEDIVVVREEENLRKAVRCMEILEIDLDVDLFGEECVADGHREHSPRVPDGKDGLLRYFAEQLERFPQMRGDIMHAGADGDFVWLYIHFKATPDSAGNAGMHLFRMENGKFVEHWGVTQPVTDSTLHENSMF